MSVGFQFDPDSLADLIEAAVDTFDFTLPGQAGGTLGKDLAKTAALLIGDRTRLGKQADGGSFRPNVPKYAKYKHDRYSVDRPGELGGQMTSQVSVLGKPEVTAASVMMIYGWNVPPTRTTSTTGVSLKPSELKATDREKADWFTEGGRPFYELDDEISEILINLCAEAFGLHLAEAFQ